MVIDYSKLAAAQDYYKKLGYEEIYAPWLVTEPAQDLNREKTRRPFQTPLGYLVASGEQSFLQTMMNGVQLGKCFCVTPCFRDEPVLDKFHHSYFMKLELINTQDTTAFALGKMIIDAAEFFDKYLDFDCLINATKLGFDLCELRTGIEVGSYGIREHQGHKWVYGTGLALPRLDDVISESNLYK